MNHIYLDFDAVNKKPEALQLAADMEDTDILLLGNGDEAKAAEKSKDAAPARGILITRLNSGWLQYHFGLLRENPMLIHWVVAILWDGKQNIRDMLNKQLLSVFEKEDIYCEIVFEDTENWEKIKETLQKPIKTQKSCAVISKNLSLAQDAAAILQAYLKDWAVHFVDGVQNNDYSCEDAVLTVGGNNEEMAVYPPEKGARKRLFWRNEAYFLEDEEKFSTISELGEQMNGLGWNIFNYQKLAYISSIVNEKALLAIRQEEMVPIALKTDDNFIMWDDYGLPIPSNSMDDNNIRLFLEKNTTFLHIAHQIATNKSNEEQTYEN